MKRRLFSRFAGGLVIAAPLGALAQPRDVPIVGVLIAGRTSSMDPLRAGLREAGFVEGAGVILEIRAADGQYDRLPGLAAELVALPSKVILAVSLPAAQAAKAATRTIPIVFTSGADPVAFGLIDNLSRPSGNLTGVTHYFGPLAAKRLELLRELVPTGGAFGVLINPANPSAPGNLETLQVAARSLGLPISVARAISDDEIEAAFARMAAERVRAVLISDDPSYFYKSELLVGLAARHAIPTIYPTDNFTAAGGLISYGAEFSEGNHVAIVYVGRILRGARPGDLPVQQPSKFHLLVNLSTARALKLAVSPAILARADEVIE